MLYPHYNWGHPPSPSNRVLTVVLLPIASVAFAGRHPCHEQPGDLLQSTHASFLAHSLTSANTGYQGTSNASCPVLDHQPPVATWTAAWHCAEAEGQGQAAGVSPSSAEADHVKGERIRWQPGQTSASCTWRGASLPHYQLRPTKPCTITHHRSRFPSHSLRAAASRWQLPATLAAK